jgi:hypothetical protein
VVRLKLVCGFDNTTEAPGTTDPDCSVMVPRTDEADWAEATVLPVDNAIARNNAERNLYAMATPSLDAAA